MDFSSVFSNLILGFTVAMSAQNLLYCFIGCLLGTLIGVLPGIGPVATIAMLLPITFNLPPIPALIMLAGIYYGASYGGSTTAILVNLPGESSSVVTCIDGYQMGRQGRAGPALAIAALGSFFAGCVGTVLIALFGPPLAELAFEFGAAEYFSMMVLGLIAAVVLASGSLIKAIGMIIIGLLGGLVGTDVNSGIARYSFGVSELSDGIGFVSVAMGMFGFGEIISNLGQTAETKNIEVSKVHSLMPTWEDIKVSIGPIMRGTAIGTIFGILPGSHTVIASFSSYTLEKKLAKDPSRFGKGAIEGVAGPESANNASAQTCFIPLLTLGLPSNPIMAIMMGAMMIQGIQPGGQLTITTEVENYPGYPDGIQGPDMMVHFEKQAQRMGADIRYGLATKVDFTASPYKVWIDEEKLVEAEKVGVMHASGKSGLIPAPDTDFRSPVLDDVAAVAAKPAETPAGVEGLGDYDFMERARMDAIKAYSSGQPS